MKTIRRQNLIAAALVGALAFTTTVSRAADPLPSWNDGPAKKSIVDFVAKVTKPGSPDFVPVPERIAMFDNDGTLWCEQPVPVQFYFATRPREGARAAASRMEDQGTVRLAAQGRCERPRSQAATTGSWNSSWPRTPA